MHSSLSNLLKFINTENQGNTHLSYEKMSLEELRKTHHKFKGLSCDKKITNSLPDKGDKIAGQLKQIEIVIRDRCSKLADELQKESNEVKEECKLESEPIEQLLAKFQSLVVARKNKSEDECKTETKETSDTKPDSVEASSTSRLLDSIKDEKLRNQMETELISPENQPKNYFAKTTTTTTLAKDHKKPGLKKTDAELKAIRDRIVAKMRAEKEAKQVKTLSLEESCRILKEHEKKVQELHIEQTAQKLMQGQSVVYDYSFLNSNADLKSYRDAGRKQTQAFDSSSKPRRVGRTAEEADFENDHYGDPDDSSDDFDHDNCLIGQIDDSDLAEATEKPRTHLDNQLESID